jgi:hypothetical protein
VGGAYTITKIQKYLAHVFVYSQTLPKSIRKHIPQQHKIKQE